MHGFFEVIGIRILEDHAARHIFLLTRSVKMFIFTEGKKLRKAFLFRPCKLMLCNTIKC